MQRNRKMKTTTDTTSSSDRACTLDRKPIGAIRGHFFVPGYQRGYRWDHNDVTCLLEDHDLLRGGLTVFDLDPKLFTQRAETFIAIFDKPAYSGSMPWMLVTGALLANGDYSRRVNRWTGRSYQVCMLDKERMSSDYYDPYLFAAVQQAGISPDSIANAKWPRCYTSDETNHRKLVLKNSGLQIECVDEGWQMSDVPTDTAQKTVFDQVCSEYGIGENLLYYVQQVNGIDVPDRIEKGGALLKKFVCCGF